MMIRTIANPCEYGQYYLEVELYNPPPAYSYLYSDWTIQDKLVISDTYNGYFHSWKQAYKHQQAFYRTWYFQMTNIVQIIEAKVQEWNDEQKMFTVWDMVRDLRKDNPNLSIFYGVVRDKVHDLYNGGKFLQGYLSTSISVPHVNKDATLFYVDGVHDPKDYQVDSKNLPKVSIPDAKLKERVFRVLNAKIS